MKIASWKQDENGLYNAITQDDEGIERTYHNLNQAEWDVLKETEAHDELTSLQDEIDVSRTALYKKDKDRYGLCAWCKRYWNRVNGLCCLPELTDEQFEVTRHDGTSHGCCPDCKNNMLAEAKKAKTLPAGTPVRITDVDTDSGGDTRNEARYGVIVSTICSEDNRPLYEIKFTDGIEWSEPHYMDTEAELPVGHSAHFSDELEVL